MRYPGRWWAGRLGLFGILSFLIILAIPSANALLISHDRSPAIAGESSAVIEWSTDVPATSRVDYGVTKELGAASDDPVFVKYHRIELSGLAARTTYYFQMVSIDEFGNYRIDNNDGAMYSFTTGALADRRSPVASNISVSITDGSATIAWATDIPARSAVRYGAESLSESIDDARFTVSHSVTLPIASGVFSIESCDDAGECSTTSSRPIVPGSVAAEGITVSLPRYVKTPSITVSGSAPAGADISIIVNGVRQRADTVPGDGRFSFPNVRLDRKDNVVAVSVRDAAGVESSSSFDVTVDASPPKLVVSGFPAFVTQSPFSLQGSTDGPSSVTVRVVSQADVVPPSRVSGLRVDTGDGANTLRWSPVSDEDILGYIVYRDDVRLALSPNVEFVDASAVGGKPARYRVSAVDNGCNEGSLSDSVLVTILPNNLQSAGVQPALEPLVLPCAAKEQVFDADGAFTLPLDLLPGPNLVRINARDAANNTASWENVTTLDVLEPVFEETNLDRLSPTFIPDIVVKGRLNKQGTVAVYLNNASKPVDIVVTDAEGRFSSKVNLPRGAGVVKRQKGLERAGIEGVEHTIYLEASDAAGRKVASTVSTVVFGSCGAGGPFSIHIDDPMPQEVIPRLMLAGLQTVGMPINITYRGGQNVTVSRVSVSPVLVSPELEENYDHDWVQIGAPLFRNPSKKDAGYVQLQFVNVDLLADNPDATLYQREKALADHRVGECLVPGFGCVRLLLQVEIEAQEEVKKNVVYSGFEKTASPVTVLPPVRQRSCIDVNLLIEKPVRYSDFAPTAFLNGTVKLLGGAIEVIDAVLQPLTTVGTYVLYSCFAMTAWNYFQFVGERANCDAKAALSIFEGGFDKRYAEMGACDLAYKDNARKRQLCNDCGAAIARRKAFEKTYFTVCDRVSCPSAPTLQSYIVDRQENRPAEYVKTLDGIDLYAGSDCGFTGQEEKSPAGLHRGYGSTPPPVGPTDGITSPPAQGQTAPGFSGGTKGVKEVYFDYLKHKDDARNLKQLVPAGKVSPSLVPGKVNCAGLHPSNPECCGFEYQSTFGSACGIPGVAETFDEIKESACLAAQNANDLRNFEREASSRAKSQVQCKSLFNAAAGFCQEKTGQPLPDFVGTGVKYKEKPPSSADDQVYIGIVPKRNTAKETVEYRMFLSSLQNKFSYAKQVAAGNPNAVALPSGNYDAPGSDQAFYIQSKLNLRTSSDVSRYFNAEAIEGFRSSGGKALPAGFKEAVCAEADRPSVDCSTRSVTDAYAEVVARVGATDQQYIVRPDQEGILRSVQCVCLPAVTSYLEFWKNILTAVQRCFQTVMVTGDGSPGVCQSVLSAYVCDLIYDLVRCFTEKYSTPGFGSRSGSQGIGNTLAALTGAGSDMAESIRGRYGETALWRTLFVERKLAHAVCIFAFTGTWNLDVQDVFRQTVQEIPIKSEAFMPVANRRYVSWNPLSNPKGLSTQVYTMAVGFAAGADLRYELQLKCSNGARCDPSEGFVDGKCDCFGKPERTITVSDPSLTGSLSKGEILDTEVLFPLEDSVRYDTAVLRWEYIDAGGNVVQGEPVVKSVKQIGGNAPGYCQFDRFSGAYRCEIGIGEYSGARLSSGPTPKFAEGLDVFTRKDELAFKLAVELKVPPRSREQDCAFNCPYTKYLVTRIFNQYGAEVWSNVDPVVDPYRVTADGTTEIVYPVGVKVLDDWFGRVEARSILDQTTSLPRSERAGIGGISVPGLSPTDPHIDIVVVVPDQSRFEAYRTAGVTVAGVGREDFVAQSPQNRDSGRWGYWEKNKLSLTDEAVRPFSVGVISNNILSVDLAPLGFPSGRRLVMTFSKLPVANSEFRVSYSPSAVQLGCSEFAGKPAEWRAVFELHDAKKAQYGGWVYDPEQVSVDPSSDKLQRREVVFKVVCADSYKGAAGGIQLPRLCVDPSDSPQQPCFCGARDEYNALLGRLERKEIVPESVNNCGIAGGRAYCIDTKCRTAAEREEWLAARTPQGGG